MSLSDRCFLLLGGAGLVGQQVARRIAEDLSAKKIVIAALRQDEVDDVLEGPSGLSASYRSQGITFVGESGDIFVREEFRDRSRAELLADASARDALYEDLYGDIDDSYQHNYLASLIRKHQPDVIVDCINTATAISYQDVYTGAQLARRALDTALADGATAEDAENLRKTFDALTLSQSAPQLIRHALLLLRSMREARTRVYVKVGTTGTGGMGMNIPYTHSEDKPSATLLTKSAVAFAHTGLMFLMARTAGGPIVKEVKPGAMIGYADVVQRTIRERGENVHRYAARRVELGGELRLAMPAEEFKSQGELSLPVVDTGENGLFTRGEFEAITTVRQMEFITPEEIALDVVLEIKGSNTGQDVIAAIDGAVMSPTYRAGVLRQHALNDLARLEDETGSHSVALGQLGPPELSKLLWEAHLLRLLYGDLKTVLAKTPEQIAPECQALLDRDAELRDTIVSTGGAILAPDGESLLRGPRLRIPERAGLASLPMAEDDKDRWARKGWVDLRPENFLTWQSRFATMLETRQRTHMRGTSAMTRDAYRHDSLEIGAIVGWILNNEIEGYRIK